MAKLSIEQLRKQAEEYRQRAAECRTRAEETKDDWARQSLLETAEYWMRMAVQVARRISAMEQPRGAEFGEQKPSNSGSQ